MSNIKSLAKKHTILDSAVTSLIINNPFFATILLNQETVMIEKDDPRANIINTFAVDGTSLYINREFAETLNHAQTVGVLIHEILHLALMHHARMGSRDKKKWNCACDYAINAMIKDMMNGKGGKSSINIDLPSFILYDPQYANLSAEDIYERLPDNPFSKGKEEEESGEGDGSSWNFGEILEPENATKAESIAKMQVKQAQAVAKMRGQHLPDCVNRFLETIDDSRLDWKEITSRFIIDKFPSDYNWLHADKRFLQNGIIIPDLDGESIGNFAIAIDTSGSVDEQSLKLMMAEVFGALYQVQEVNSSISIPIIYCDSDVRNVDVISSSNDIVKPAGGGGTDFDPVFKYIESNPDQFRDLKGLIYITDGFGHTSVEAPKYEVLWAVTTTQGMGMDCVKKFGESFYFNIEN